MFMIVSLSINFVLCFKGNLFIIVYVFFNCEICASWSDVPFVMGK
jgi:hypothetical protein